VILVSGTREQAEHEKAELANYLHQTTGLELSEEKTRISGLAEGFEFLGHRVRHKWHPQFALMPRVEIAKSRRADLRYRVKQMTKRSTTARSLLSLLRKLNPILRGWGNYYRFFTGASQIFASLDYYVGDRIWRWLMKKHQRLKRKHTTLRRQPSWKRPARKLWRTGRTAQFLLASLRVERFRQGWMKTPAFAMVPG
jgi:RNA-directed DNA polymerase